MLLLPRELRVPSIPTRFRHSYEAAKALSKLRRTDLMTLGVGREGGRPSHGRSDLRSRGLEGESVW